MLKFVKQIILNLYNYCLLTEERRPLFPTLFKRFSNEHIFENLSIEEVAHTNTQSYEPYLQFIFICYVI